METILDDTTMVDTQHYVFAKTYKRQHPQWTSRKLWVLVNHNVSVLTRNCNRHTALGQLVIIGTTVYEKKGIRELFLYSLFHFSVNLQCLNEITH